MCDHSKFGTTSDSISTFTWNDHRSGSGQDQVRSGSGQGQGQVRVRVRSIRVTLLWAYTTDPSSFQVPPRRSIRIMRRICRNRRDLMADVAKTFPWVPAARTEMEAISTIMSAGQRSKTKVSCYVLVFGQNQTKDRSPLWGTVSSDFCRRLKLQKMSP